MPRPRHGKKDASTGNRTLVEMNAVTLGAGENKSPTAWLPRGIKSKATSPLKTNIAPALTGKRRRSSAGTRRQAQEAEEAEGGEDVDCDAAMSEASDDQESSVEETPRPKKRLRKTGRAVSSRLQKVEVDHDLLAELGISDDEEDGIDELLNISTAVSHKARIRNSFKSILDTREEEMSDGEREAMIQRLDEAEEEDEEDEDGTGSNAGGEETEELRSMRTLGGASFGLQSHRLLETLAQSGGDVKQLVRYNFIRWNAEKGEDLRNLVLPQLYDVLNTSPSVLGASRKKRSAVETGRLTPESAFLTTSGWLQIFRKTEEASSREELCSFLYRIVAHCDEAHTRASAFHLLDAIVRDEETIALSSVTEVAPSMLLIGDGWALPYHSFLRSIEAYGMDISSFIPPEGDDEDTPLLEMGTAFATTEPSGADCFPQKNVLLVVRLMEASVNAKPDMYSADELVDMVLLAFCFLLDPWLQKGVLVLESFITSCLNAFTAKQWKGGAVQKICNKLCDPTILADETQLVGALKHVAISVPREAGVDRGRLIKGHASVMALCSMLGTELPDFDYTLFPPVDFIVKLVVLIREDADTFTDAVKATPSQKKRDYTRLYAILCLLDTAIDKRLYEAAKNRAALKELSSSIRQLDTRIKDKGGVLHLARKRVKEKLLVLLCTVDLLLI